MHHRTPSHDEPLLSQYSLWRRSLGLAVLLFSSPVDLSPVSILSSSSSSSSSSSLYSSPSTLACHLPPPNAGAAAPRSIKCSGVFPSASCANIARIEGRHCLPFLMEINGAVGVALLSFAPPFSPILVGASPRLHTSAILSLTASCSLLSNLRSSFNRVSSASIKVRTVRRHSLSPVSMCGHLLCFFFFFFFFTLLRDGVYVDEANAAGCASPPSLFLLALLLSFAIKLAHLPLFRGFLRNGLGLPTHSCNGVPSWGKHRRTADKSKLNTNFTVDEGAEYRHVQARGEAVPKHVESILGVLGVGAEAGLDILVCARTSVLVSTILLVLSTPASSLSSILLLSFAVNPLIFSAILLPTN